MLEFTSLPYWDTFWDTLLDLSEPYWDTFKSFGYFGLGIISAWGFWNVAEQYAKKGLRFVDPVLFFVMVIWGASGFFFLGVIEGFLYWKIWGGFFDGFLNFCDPVLDLIFHPVPDWDIRSYIWAKSSFSEYSWEFLKHRSWLFSSVMIPLILLGITIIASILYQSRSVKKFHHYLNMLRNITIGLFVGMSAHLFGDFFLSFINRGDIGFKIYNWNSLSSSLWFIGNILLGILIPFFLIRLKSITHEKKLRRRVKV